MKPDFIRSTLGGAYKRFKRIMIGDTTERNSLQPDHHSGDHKNSSRLPCGDADIQGEILGIHRDWMPLLGRWY
jgi:hypothetical protein